MEGVFPLCTLGLDFLSSSCLEGLGALDAASHALFERPCLSPIFPEKVAAVPITALVKIPWLSALPDHGRACRLCPSVLPGRQTGEQ